jgi:glycosyltransferase involved in cell wall biosynthesis
MWIEAGGDWLPTPVFHRGGAPIVGYFIDSHSRLEQHKAVAEQFTHRFCAQRQYADALGATWLPVACDPDVHTPTRTGPPEYDVAFVGNTYGDSPMYARRREVLDLLAGRYKCNFQSGVYFEDMANVYASARVAFNVSTNGDLNMRVFEAMCSGRPLVTDGVEGLGWLYEGGEVGPLAYANEADMLATIDSLLAEPISAAECGRFARLNAIARHTYLHRAQQMLKAVGQ